uniref:Putative secreted protein n=1 Tax=Anopheles darlingi TaxID=43151 RepID=A0A2M4DJG5_ANODA
MLASCITFVGIITMPSGCISSAVRENTQFPFEILLQQALCLQSLATGNNRNRDAPYRRLRGRSLPFNGIVVSTRGKSEGERE